MLLAFYASFCIFLFLRSQMFYTLSRPLYFPSGRQSLVGKPSIRGVLLLAERPKGGKDGDANGTCRVNDGSSLSKPVQLAYFDPSNCTQTF